MTLEKKVLIGVAVVAAAHLTYFAVFQCVHVTLSVIPDALEPDGRSTAEIRVVRWNRLSTEIPWMKARLRCTVLEGGELVTILQSADSTSITVTARDRTGTAAFRITTDASPLPLYCRIPISTPLAMGRSAPPSASQRMILSDG